MSVHSESVPAPALRWKVSSTAALAWFGREIALPLLATRFVLTLIGFVAINTMPVNPHDDGISRLPVRHAWINTWARWDAVWYARIARDGYFYSPQGQSSAAVEAVAAGVIGDDRPILGGPKVIAPRAGRVRSIYYVFPRRIIEVAELHGRVSSAAHDSGRNPMRLGSCA